MSGARGALIALLSVALAAPVAGLGGSGPAAEATVRPGLTVDSTEPTVHVGRKLPPGAPLGVVKPPYPEECGLGPVAPFAAFCDVIPLHVDMPTDLGPGDDVTLAVVLTWPQAGTVPCSDSPPPVGEHCHPTPSTNLDMWLWDDGQSAGAKEPVPDFEGLSTTWTPAEVTSEYTLLAAGTGAVRPQKIRFADPYDGDYNLLVANFNSELSPQTSGACPAAGGPPGCYVVTAHLEIERYTPPHEKFPPS